MLILGVMELKGTRIPGACSELGPVYVIPEEASTLLSRKPRLISASTHAEYETFFAP
jgi:hypothetical protein